MDEIESAELSFDPISDPQAMDYWERKLRALKEFLTMTESLKAKLDLQDMSAVIQLLDQRQNLIHLIDQMDSQIREIRFKSLLADGQYPDEIEERVSFVSKTIEELLQKVEILNQQCVSKFTSWRDEIRGELIKMRHGLRAVQFYAEVTVHPPRFLDVRR